MSVPVEVVRADFNRIGRLTRGAELDRSNRLALERIRPAPGSILEVGCGIGALSERLEARTRRLVAIDASPVMTRLTDRRCTHTEVIEADVMTWQSRERFETVVSVAMLHHVPLDVGLARLASFVAPGGQLVIVDLFDAGYFAYSAVNVVLRMFRRPRHGGAELAAAWAEHAMHEHMPKLRDVRAACRRVLPDARVTRHLEWRYSIVSDC
ncbi:MAG: SAM-dependent methyltransferase [Myxococcales bacterium]|nr:SAM-dependent methyltransferase [Myxococcales bacterium]